MDCIYCKIVERSAPATVVYEDDHMIGLHPPEQVSKGHTLLVPKIHSQDIFDIAEQDLIDLAKAAKHLSAQLVEDNQATGLNMVHASGKDAQQSILHFHIHLIPRYPDDGLDMWINQKL